MRPSREAPPRRRGRGGRRVRRILLGALLLAAAVAGYLGFRAWTRPYILRVDPVLAEPGGILRIEGRNFGAERGESFVELDGIAPTASSYVEWSPGSIAVRVPAAADSGLVYVSTSGGRRSNAKLFMNRASLPRPARGGGGAGGGPYVSSLSAQKGAVGSLLVISGRSFGSSREEGAVLFARQPEPRSSSSSGREEALPAYNAEEDLGYELWSDKEIRVRVPDGAVSGAVGVRNRAGSSNGLFFDVVEAPGQKLLGDSRSYAISYGASVSEVRSSGPNEIYLWLPRPSESASQRLAGILSQEPLPMVSDYRGASLYRFKDVQTGLRYAASQSFLVKTWEVEVRAEPEKIRVPQDPPPLVRAYLRQDELVPAEATEVVSLARRIVGAEKNPWRSARLVHDWVVKNLAFQDGRDQAKPLAALAERRAGAQNMAVLEAALLRASGVPALPVAGVLVDPSRKVLPHAWVEFYVFGLGWVPADPVLASGARPGGLAPAFEDPARYFGSLDNRRIAFSRGLASLVPMTQGGRRSSPARPIAFQSFFEEASGAIEAYATFWSDVEVTGLY